jgi:polyhydroxyalkanoate synthesis regulator phasin
MTTTIAELTTEQFTELLSEFYAEPVKRNKMTMDEIKDLAQRLNRKINVPIISETGEEKILIKIILKIDTFLYDHLPNEFYDMIRSTDRGIDKKEAKRLVRRLTKLANEKIDIPYLPEVAEHFAIKFVIGIVVRAAQKNLNFENARMDSDRMVIPESDDDIELLVEN